MTTHANSRLAAILLLAAVLAGCATSSALRSGKNAELAQDFDRAVVEYTRALQQDPDNRDARFGLERSRPLAAQNHFTRGRRFHAMGRLNEALVELELAAELNSTDPNVEELLSTVRTQLQTKVAVARDGKTELETLIERSRDMRPTGGELPSDVRLPA